MSGPRGEGHEELLRLEKLCASNQKSTILKDINFTLRAREIHGIVSTSEFYLQRFMDALAGLIPITGGIIYLRGTPCPRRELTKGHVMFVCQETQLFDEFTGIHNIFINDRAYYRMSRREKRRLAEQVLQKFDLDIDLNCDARELTTEERKIVEVLRALKSEAPIVMLHDTFNLVSVEYAPCLKRIINQMLEQGKGVCYVSTDAEGILTCSDRISVMDDGQIKGEFETEQVIDNPREIMSLISGWDTLTNEQEDQISSRIYDALAKSREIMISSAEIKQVIHVLAMNFRQALRADGCIIYLIDEESNGIINSLYPEETAQAPRLTNAYILSCAHNEDIIYMDRSSESFGQAFVSASEQVGTMLCINVFSNGKQTGFIQAWFRSSEKLNVRRFHYLTSFARDVNIAVETSRLMGRSILLKESHHRIKNNLQLIINLIYMQKLRLINQSCTTQDINAILDAVIERIKSIAIVHEMFSSNKLGQGAINLRVMTVKLLNMYRMADVTYETEMDDFSIPYGKATSIALIINELISNCMKHAFPTDQRDKCVRLEFHHDGNEITLKVQDNGVGLPPDLDLSSSDSLGISIIRSILDGMQGTLDYETSRGTCALVQIPMCMFYK